MYRLVDLRNCQNDIGIRQEQPCAIVDTEDVTIAAITCTGHLIYCNRAFLLKYDLDCQSGFCPDIRETLPRLRKKFREPDQGEKRNLKVFNLRLNSSGRPVGHLLVSFEKGSSSPRNRDLYTLVSVDNHPDFIESYAGLYVANPQADTIKVNPSYEKIAFLPESDLVGRNLRELVEKGYFSRSVTLSILNGLQLQSNCKQTFFQKLICGKEVLVTGTPIYSEQKELAYIVTFVRDLFTLETMARKCIEYDQQTSAVWPGVELSRRITPECKQKEGSSGLPEFAALPLVARDPLAIATFKKAVCAAGYKAPILLTGETGVGKDLMAKYIHLLRGAGDDKPFISVNCSAIPGELLESELFGYEEGAFSGARKGGKTGLFTAADGGILFLNEISEMPLGLQAKLLRVLDEGCIRRLGSSVTRQVKARIICATNRDLGRCIQEGSLRSDLYYRIKVLTIDISPLRDRRRDILPLVYHFMARLSAEYGLKRYLSPEVQEILLGYNWPGNVRELRNVVERMLVFSSTNQVSLCDLPAELTVGGSDTLKRESSGLRAGVTLKKAVGRYERHLIEATLQRYSKAADAARILGIDPTTLFRKLRKID